MGVDLRKLVGMVVSFMVAMLLCLMMQMLVSGCGRTVYVPVESVRHDSLIQTKVFVDTLVTRDSVYVRESGDTVYFCKWKTEYRYRYVMDTMYVAKVDSVAVPYEVVKTERYVPSAVWYIVGGLVLAVLGMGAWVRLR